MTDSDPAKNWHSVLQKCLLLLVVTGCGVVLNLFILTALGGLATGALKPS